MMTVYKIYKEIIDNSSHEAIVMGEGGGER